MFKVFIGYDPRDDLAFKVAEQSIRRHATIPVEVIPLKEWELRQRGAYHRGYHVDGAGQMWDVRDGQPFSTQFSFTRFLVPHLMDYRAEWVLFMDADMMLRADIKDLIHLIDDSKAVMCVKHDHWPTEQIKMDGVLQTKYRRKNWSSFMLLRPDRCKGLTRYAANNWSGSDLHQMKWVEDDLIGSLPNEWNFLAGYDEAGDPKNVHFTLGTPDMCNAVDTPWDGEWWGYADSRKVAA